MTITIETVFAALPTDGSRIFFANLVTKLEIEQEDQGMVRAILLVLQDQGRAEIEYGAGWYRTVEVSQDEDEDGTVLNDNGGRFSLVVGNPTETGMGGYSIVDSVTGWSAWFGDDDDRDWPTERLEDLRADNQITGLSWQDGSGRHVPHELVRRVELRIGRTAA